MPTRKRILTDEPELAMTGEFEPDNDEPWFDDDDQPQDDAWLDPDAEPTGEVGLGQATVSDPDAAMQPDVADNQLTDPLGDQSVGDAATEVASDQSEAAPSDQQPEATSPPPPDPVAELLAGSDEELEAAIQQAQAEADAAAEELELFNQRVAELQAAYERIAERIRELKVQRAELVPEALLRNNQRAKQRLAKLGADLRELETLGEDHKLALEAAAIESVRLLAALDQHNQHRRRLEARLAARRLARQAQVVDQVIVTLLGELARAQQLVEELAPLLPDSAQQYLNQFRRGGGDLPIRLSLAYHCRNMGVGSILDLPAYSPQSSRPLAVQIGELLANLLKPATDNSEVSSAELHGTDAPGSATTAQ